MIILHIMWIVWVLSFVFNLWFYKADIKEELDAVDWIIPNRIAALLVVFLLFIGAPMFAFYALRELPKYLKSRKPGENNDEKRRYHKR